MNKNYSISIIIPCLDEERGLKKLLPEIPSFVDEIIVIDNGSKDKSKEVVKSLDDPRIKIVEEEKQGYGSALIRGLKEAREDLIIAMDADGNHLINDIIQLVNKISKDNLDFAWGSRFPLQSRNSMPILKFLGNKILTFLTNILFGLKIKDSQCGMWVIKRGVLGKLKLTQNGMAFSEELKLEVIAEGFKYKEIPIGYQKRVGQSKLSIIKDGFFNLVFLFKKKLSLKEKNNKNILAKTLCIGLFSFAIFTFVGLQNKNLMDPDSFFHIRLSQQISQTGINLFSNIPWLPFMPGYIDSNTLYHWFLSSFSSLGLVLAYKIFGILTASLIFASFYFILNKHRVNYPLIWTLIIFSSSDFVFRLLLFRPFLISILSIILSFYFLSRKKSLQFFLVTVLYPLFYVLPFSIFLALVFLISKFIKEGVIKLKFLVLSLLGTVIGFLLNPSFPKNINYTSVQIFKTTFSHNAAELQPLNFKEFLAGNFLLWLFFAGIVAVFIYLRKEIKERISVEGLSAFLISIFFFLLMVRSNRFIEYWVPFTVLAGALVARDFEIDKKFINFLKGIFRQGSEPWRNNRLLKLAKFLPISAVCLFIFMIFLNSIAGNYLALKNTPPYDRYKPAAEWFIQNTPEKSIVFNVSWDDFPELFYWNDHNYYIVGMDPTFMYEYDKNLYEKWRRVGDGEDEKPGETVKKYFSSQVIFVNKFKNPKFIKIAVADTSLEKSYEDDWSIIYKIKN